MDHDNETVRTAVALAGWIIGGLVLALAAAGCAGKDVRPLADRPAVLEQVIDSSLDADSMAPDVAAGDPASASTAPVGANTTPAAAAASAQVPATASASPTDAAFPTATMVVAKPLNIDINGRTLGLLSPAEKITPASPVESTGAAAQTDRRAASTSMTAAEDADGDAEYILPLARVRPWSDKTVADAKPTALRSPPQKSLPAVSPSLPAVSVSPPAVSAAKPAATAPSNQDRSLSPMVLARPTSDVDIADR